MFYLTNNTNRKEPEAIAPLSYLHIKASQDGSQTLILCDEELDDPNYDPKTLQEAQQIVNDWVDLDNQTPPIDVEGNPHLADYINLEAFI